jgi:hypothetical protein
VIVRLVQASILRPTKSGRTGRDDVEGKRGAHQLSVFADLDALTTTLPAA